MASISYMKPKLKRNICFVWNHEYNSNMHSQPNIFVTPFIYFIYLTTYTCCQVIGQFIKDVVQNKSDRPNEEQLKLTKLYLTLLHP